MEEEKRMKLIQWYDDKYNYHCAFCNKIKNLIEEIINSQSIPYQSISARVKEKNSFLRKCENNKYSDPINQIMDVIGVRIIAYTISDVNKICELLEREFIIDSENSEDKASKMKENEVGYLSVHYIAKLNNSRSSLSEYSRYKDIKFEIQVRTLLQHAWAEIEHDRNYKFGGVLPKELKRRFFLAAGILEMVDREFQNLSDEIDKYSKEVKEKTSKGDLSIPIDSTSLFEYLSEKINSPFIEKTFFNDEEVIEELRNFGILTLEDLDKIIPVNYVNYINAIESMNCHTNFTGILRDFMILNDYKKYFDNCWNKHWKGLDIESYILYKRWGLPVDKIVSKLGLLVEPDWGKGEEVK